MLITLEGIDGSGKTTALGYMSEFLHEKQIPHVTLSLPCATEFGKKIYEILQSGIVKNKDTELSLFIASHLEAIVQIIEPALKLGQIVICDRFIESTRAYACGGHNINRQRITGKIRSIIRDHFIRADCIFYFDIDPIASLARIDKKDKYDSYDFSFYERVRTKYMAILDHRREQYLSQCFMIDADRPLDIVQENVLEILDRCVLKKENYKKVKKEQAMWKHDMSSSDPSILNLASVFKNIKN